MLESQFGRSNNESTYSINLRDSIVAREFPHRDRLYSSTPLVLLTQIQGLTVFDQQAINAMFSCVKEIDSSPFYTSRVQYKFPFYNSTNSFCIMIKGYRGVPEAKQNKAFYDYSTDDYEGVYAGRPYNRMSVEEGIKSIVLSVAIAEQALKQRSMTVNQLLQRFCVPICLCTSPELTEEFKKKFEKDTIARENIGSLPSEYQLCITVNTSPSHRRLSERFVYTRETQPNKEIFEHGFIAARNISWLLNSCGLVYNDNGGHSKDIHYVKSDVLDNFELPLSSIVDWGDTILLSRIPHHLRIALVMSYLKEAYREMPNADYENEMVYFLVRSRNSPERNKISEEISLQRRLGFLCGMLGYSKKEDLLNNFPLLNDINLLNVELFFFIVAQDILNNANFQLLRNEFDEKVSNINETNNYTINFKMERGRVFYHIYTPQVAKFHPDIENFDVEKIEQREILMNDHFAIAFNKWIKNMISENGQLHEMYQSLLSNSPNRYH